MKTVTESAVRSDSTGLAGHPFILALARIATLVTQDQPNTFVDVRTAWEKELQ